MCVLLLIIVIRSPLLIYLDFERVKLMGCLGLEPRTYRLKAEYSTIELATLLFCHKKHAKKESFSISLFSKRFFKWAFALLHYLMLRILLQP